MRNQIVCSAEERKKYMRNFCKKYPMYETGILGKSILSRDIDYYRIGLGNKNIVVVGAHHAMEYLTSAVLFDFIDFLCENATRGSSVHNVNARYLVKSYSFWIVPCLNPDGVEMHLNGIEGNPLYERQLRMNGGSHDFSDWQSNARGVDLNHNYNALFHEYKFIEAERGILAGKTRYAGEYPESEPESRAIANLIRVLSPITVVSLHTQGEEIFFKPDTERVRRIGTRLAKAVGYKMSRPEGLASFGGLVDYTGDKLGIPSFTVELGKGENPLAHSMVTSLSDVVRKLLILLPMYL